MTVGSGLKIERVEVLIVSLPQRRAHVSAVRASRLGLYVITKVHAGGLIGLGEATVLKEWGGDHGRYYGEAPETTARLLVDYLAPAILGMDARAITSVLQKLDQAVRGYPYAKASIDIALHDLVGQALGVPVYQLLGGPVREAIPLAHSLGVMEMPQLLAEAEAAVAEGATTLKMKVGFDAERDVHAVSEVRRLVGDEIALTVDANRGWRDVKLAISTIRRLEAFGIRFAEQPVEGLDAMSRVTAAVDTMVMADESAWNPTDVLEIARMRAADLISLYTTKPGGLQRAAKTAAVAEAAGIRCNINGSAETGVGNAANVHLAAAMEAVSEACVLPVSSPAEGQPTATVGRMYLDDLIVEPFDYRDGHLVVPSEPGLGVRLDESKVAKYVQAEFIVQP
jgi:muconate cycloisomerase